MIELSPNTWILIAIVLAGVGSYAMRAVFIVLLADAAFPPLAKRALEYVGPAVMGALVVSMLSSSDGTINIGPAELFGLGAAAIVAAKTRNHLMTLLAGMVVFWFSNFWL